MASKNDESLRNDLSSIERGVEMQVEIEGIAEVSKVSQLNKWSIRETRVLVEGKITEESRTKNINATNRSTSKWDNISSFCTKNGMKRGPVQCQNRWSKLMEHFRKIKASESVKKQEDKSFWNMTVKERRVIKLPIIFDREVYDILDGKPWHASTIPLNQTDDENPPIEIQVTTGDSSNKIPSIGKNELVNGHEEVAFKEPSKRIRLSDNGNQKVDVKSELINVIGQCHTTLKSYLDVTEKNNEQDDGLVAALKKIGNALEMIADKL